MHPWKCWCLVPLVLVLCTPKGYMYPWLRTTVLWQHMLKAIEVLSTIASVSSQILCQLTAKMACVLKSLTIVDWEVKTVKNATSLKMLNGIKLVFFSLTEKSSKFSCNIWIYGLMNTVMPNFNTTVGQMTEMLSSIWKWVKIVT